MFKCMTTAFSSTVSLLSSLEQEKESQSLSEFGANIRDLGLSHLAEEQKASSDAMCCVTVGQTDLRASVG